jgi:hypothetical protein
LQTGIPHKFVYTPQVKQYLKTIESAYFSLIRTKIESQLRLESTVETRSRKLLKQQADFKGEWELRFAPDSRFHGTRMARSIEQFVSKKSRNLLTQKA